jgi:putative hemolysin
MRSTIAAIAAVATALLAGCGSGVASAAPPATSAQVPATADALPLAAASSYCTQTGGEVEVRHAVYGSNSSKLLFLAGVRTFCQYTAKKDGSRIHVLLSTLYTTKPTLAALAYILKPPPVGSCKGNPASCYCTQLGGSDQFGATSGGGGGWYEKKGIDQTLEACVFPDMSSIDSWGLTYHANGIIRGIDLDKVLRYKYPG